MLGQKKVVQRAKEFRDRVNDIQHQISRLQDDIRATTHQLETNSNPREILESVNDSLFGTYFVLAGLQDVLKLLSYERNAALLMASPDVDKKMEVDDVCA